MATVIEEVARAMCAGAGFDPNEIMANDGPRWRYYVPSAIHAIRTLLSGPVGDVLRAAIRRAEATDNPDFREECEADCDVYNTATALPTEITDMLGGE